MRLEKRVRHKFREIRREENERRDKNNDGFVWLRERKLDKRANGKDRGCVVAIASMKGSCRTKLGTRVRRGSQGRARARIQRGGDRGWKYKIGHKYAGGRIEAT